MSHLVAGVKWIWVKCDARYDSVRARKLFMFRDHDENCSMCLIFLRWKRREKKSITSTHPEGHGWYVLSLTPSSGFYLIAIITDEMLDVKLDSHCTCDLCPVNSTTGDHKLSQWFCSGLEILINLDWSMCNHQNPLSEAGTSPNNI